LADQIRFDQNMVFEFAKTNYVIKVFKKS